MAQLQARIKPADREKALLAVKDVASFRKTQRFNEDVAIPEVPHNRKLTDIWALIAMTLSILLLLSLVIYTVSYSNIQRLIHGYDKCGNICGKENTYVEGIACSGQDQSDKPFLQYSVIWSLDGEEFRPEECVESCGLNYTEYFHRCIPKAHRYSNFFEEVVGYVNDEINAIIILSLIGLGLSAIMLVLFRYFVAIFVWCMMVSNVLLFFAASGVFWYAYADWGHDSTYLSLGIIFTILAFVFLVLILCIIPDIKLVIDFMKVAVKIVFSMPLIILQPVLTLLINLAIVALFVYTTMLMISAGELTWDVTTLSYTYQANGAMIFALVFNVIIVIWLLLFTLGCQQMVIAGAVASYYFTRDKLTLISPIYNSLYNVVRFHLGSAAFGSLIITAITVLKMIIRGLSRNNTWGQLLLCCLRPIENLLRYVTSMGYIEVAIHGKSLWQCSIRAVNLVVANILTAVAVNAVGDLVFFMIKVLVVAATVGFGVLMMETMDTDMTWTFIVIGAIIAFLSVHCFFVVIQTALDTIFLCYCEDQCLNDGVVNSYYTTLDIQEYVKKMQRLALEKEKAKEKRKQKK